MTTKRTWMTVSIALIAMILVIWLAPSQRYKPQGILLPAQEARAPIAPVRVVRLKKQPLGSVLLGYINIERYYVANSRSAEMQIWRFAQTLAAKVGANAIVIQMFQVGSVTKGRYIYIFQAKAIFVPNLQSNPFIISET